MKSSVETIEFSSRVKRLYLSDIIHHKLINRSDIRSIRKWCKDNHLQINKDTSGEYVFEAEFNLAYDIPVLKKLKKQFPKDWKTAYQHYLNDEVYQIASLEVSQVVSSGYQPKGSIAKKFKNK